MIKKTLHFKSKEAYRKWRSYGWMRTAKGELAKSKKTTIFAKTPGHQKIAIAGKPQKVMHKRIY